MEMKHLLPAFFLTLALLCVTARAEPTPADLNAAIGEELFTDENLWDDDANTVATRLRWPQESETKADSSYRKYPDASALFLGARPYSQVLYGEEGLVSGLSIVFANKGDAVTMSPNDEKLKKDAVLRRERKSQILDYKRTIQQDRKTLTASLTSLLGEPTSDRFMQGSGSTGDSVMRWDWKGHTFLLAAPRDEYVSLRIAPSSVADTRGRSRLSDSEMRERLLSRIERRLNGDVVLGDFPMVDQGPKGYCVPATWERMMRYMGVPADMYVLAMAGETGEGGGTSMSQLLAGTKSAIVAAGRRSSTTGLKLQVNDIARIIDRGTPIMWGMFSTEEYNDALRSRIKDREAMTDPKAWNETLKQARKDAKKLRGNKERAHACMIIGYNKDTRELCVSDSWGPEFRERWVTEEEAQAVSMNSFFVIEI